MALKLVWRLVNTVSKEGPEVYRMVSSAYRWIRESPAAIATSLMYTEKSVSPRIEPCGTTIDCQKPGQQTVQFNTLNSIREVVGEPGEAII